MLIAGADLRLEYSPIPANDKQIQSIVEEMIMASLIVCHREMTTCTYQTLVAVAGQFRISTKQRTIPSQFEVSAVALRYGREKFEIHECVYNSHLVRRPHKIEIT